MIDIKGLKKTGIPERFRYPSKPVISPVKKEYTSSVVIDHHLTKEENNTVDILIEPILTRRMLNAFEASCTMKRRMMINEQTTDKEVL